MLIRFATTTFVASIFAAALATGCTVSASTDTGTDSTLRIQNDEDFDITHLWIDPSGFAESDDLLGGVPLQTGGDFIDVQVSCGTYDIEFTDDGPAPNDCQIQDFSLCGESDLLDIDTAFVADCVFQ